MLLKIIKINVLLLFVAAISYAGLSEEATVCDNQLEGVVAVLGKANMSPLNFGEIKEMDFSGVVVIAQNQLPTEPVKKFVESGFVVYAKSSPSLNLQDCQNGVFIFSLGRGNALPFCDGNDVYKSPVLISFNCINKQ